MIKIVGAIIISFNATNLIISLSFDVIKFIAFLTIPKESGPPANYCIITKTILR